MPLSYRDILDLYDSLGGAGQDNVSDFSRYMNREYETDLFREGEKSNALREGSIRFTDWLGNSPVGSAAASVTGDIAQTFGFDRSVGEEVGRSLPRQAVDFAPAIGGGIIGTLLGGPVGGVIGLGIGNTASAGLSGLNTYGETGSGFAGLISGGTQFAMPGVGKYGSRLASEALERLAPAGIDVLGTAVQKVAQRPITEALGELAGEVGAQTLVGELGGVAANTAARMDVGQQSFGDALVDSAKDWASPENLFATLLGEVPFFVGMDLPQTVSRLRGPVGHRTETEAARYHRREEAVDKLGALFEGQGTEVPREQLDTYLDEYLTNGVDINEYTFQTPKVEEEPDLLQLTGPVERPVNTSRLTRPALEGPVSDDIIEGVILGKDGLFRDETISGVSEADVLPADMVTPAEAQETADAVSLSTTLNRTPDEILEKPVEFFAASEPQLREELTKNSTLRENYARLSETYPPLEALARATKASIATLPEMKRQEFETLMTMPEQMTQYDSLIRKSADMVASKRGASFDGIENLIGTTNEKLNVPDEFVEKNLERLNEVAQDAFGQDFEFLDTTNQSRILDDIHDSEIQTQIREVSKQLMGLSRVVEDDTLFENAILETTGGKLKRTDPRFAKQKDTIKKYLPFIFGQTESFTKDDARLSQMREAFLAKHGSAPARETFRKYANAAVRYFNDFYKQVGIENLYEQLPSKAEQSARPVVEETIRVAAKEFVPEPVADKTQEQRVRAEYDETFQQIQEQRPQSEEDSIAQDIPMRQDEDTDLDEGAYGFQVLKKMIESISSRAGVPTELIWDRLSVQNDLALEGEPAFNAGAAGMYQVMSDLSKHYITLTRAASADTVAHESAHFYSILLEAAAEHPDAPAQMKADYAELRKWAELQDGETLRVRSGDMTENVERANELVAEGFMKYLREGTAPTPKLKALFENIKRWLKDVFPFLDKNLTPEIKDVFSRWLTTPEQDASEQDFQKRKERNKIRSEEEGKRKKLQEATSDQVEVETVDGDVVKLTPAIYSRRRTPASTQEAIANDLRHLSESSLSVGRTYLNHGIKQGMSPREAAQFAAKAVAIAEKIGTSPLKFGDLPPNARPTYFGLFNDVQGVGRLAAQVLGNSTVPFDYMVMGHEVAHGLFQDYKKGMLPKERKRAFDKVVQLSRQLNGDDRALVLKEIASALIPHGERSKEMLNVFANVDDDEEFIVSLLGLSAMSGSKSGVKESLKFLPHEIIDFSNGFYRDMFEYTDAIAQNFADPKTAKRFQGLATHLKSVLSPDPEAMRLDAQVLKLAQSDPHEFAALIQQGQIPSDMEKVLLMFTAPKYLKAIPGVRGPMGEGEQPGFLERNFQAFWQLAQKYPQLAVIEDLGRAHREIAHYWRTKALSPFAVSAGKIKEVEPDFKTLRKVYTNPQAKAAFDRIRKIQSEGKKVLSDEDLNRELRGVPSHLRNDVASMSRKFDKANLQAAEVWRSVSRDRIAVAVATALQGLHAERAKAGGPKVPRVDSLDKLSRLFVESMFVPDKAPVVMQSLQNDPEALQTMMRVFDSLKGKYDALDKTLADNVGYSPESSNGFLVMYDLPDGTTVRLVARNAKEHRKNLEKATLDKERQGELRVQTPSSRRDENVTGVEGRILEAYNDVERAAFDAALETIKDEGLREQFAAEYTPGDAISRWKAAQSMNRHMLRKKGNRDDKGTFDYMSENLRYLNSLPYFAAKDFVTARKPLYLNDASLREHPNLVNLASAHINNVVNPLSTVVGKAANLNFLYWLGFNPSSALMDLSQSIFVAVPNLVREGRGIGESYRTVGKAAQVALKTWKGESSGDKQLDAVLQLGYDTGAIDKGASAIFGDELEHLQHSIYQLGRPQDGLGLGKIVGDGWYWLNKASRYFYKNSGEFNSKVGLIAGYYSAKKDNPNATVRELFDKASRFNNSSNFAGGAAARPVFKDVDKVIGRNPRGMIYSLSHYVTSMYGLYALRAQEGLGKLPISYEDKKAARKALAVMTGTQLLAGGALGLPLVGSALALVNQFFGLDVENEVKEWLKENASSPEQGHLLGMLAMNGAGAYAGPIDVSARVGLGTVLGIDNYDGLSATDVMGPTVGIAAKYADAYQRWQSGDTTSTKALVQLLPNGIRRVIQAGLDGGAVRGSQGRLVYEPDAGERLALAAGFQPRKLTEQRTQSNLQYKAAQARNSELKKWRGQLADMYDPNNPESALRIQSEVLERQKAELTLDVDQELGNISKIIADRNIPDDPHRLGPKQGGRRMVAMPKTGEADRYLFEKNIEAMLNPMSRGVNPKQLGTLQMVDQIIQQYNVSTPQAKAILDLTSAGYDLDFAVSAVRDSARSIR